MRLDVTLENRNLAPDGFDVAIRYGKAGHARQPSSESMQPLCSPRLVTELALPLSEPADLAHHTLLHLAMDSDSNGMPAERDAG